jgi:toxin ParE1/3/4
MAVLQFTPPALLDLEQILLYIAADSPRRSRHFVDRVVERCTLLARHPLAGRVRPEFFHVDAGMRSWSVKPVVVFYRYVQTADRVDVLRIVDGRRDLRTVFADDI